MLLAHVIETIVLQAISSCAFENSASITADKLMLFSILNNYSIVIEFSDEPPSGAFNKKYFWSQNEINSESYKALEIMHL